MHDAFPPLDLLQSNLVPWRGDSGLNDTWSDTKSLIGGFYDGGDHIKYSYTIATTVTFLSWSVLEFSKVRPLCTGSGLCCRWRAMLAACALPLWQLC